MSKDDCQVHAHRACSRRDSSDAPAPHSADPLLTSFGIVQVVPTQIEHLIQLRTRTPKYQYYSTPVGKFIINLPDNLKISRTSA